MDGYASSGYRPLCRRGRLSTYLLVSPGTRASTVDEPARPARSDGADALRGSHHPLADVGRALVAAALRRALAAQTGALADSQDNTPRAELAAHLCRQLAGWRVRRTAGDAGLRRTDAYRSYRLPFNAPAFTGAPRLSQTADRKFCSTGTGELLYPRYSSSGLCHLSHRAENTAAWQRGQANGTAATRPCSGQGERPTTNRAYTSR